MVLCSSRTGQSALQALPSSANDRAFKSSIDIGNYPLPKHAVSDVGSSSTSEKGKRGGKPSRKGTPAEGIAVWKINKNGKLQARNLAFSSDRRSLLVTSSRIKSIRCLFKADGNTKKLDISRIDRIQKGLHTSRFRRANPLEEEEDRNNSNNNKLNSPELIQDVLQQGKTMSIIYEAEGIFESLDLAISDQDDYDNLLGALEGLVQLHRDESESTSKALQLLQYHWVDMGKSLENTQDGPLSLSDFLQLADRMDFLESLGKSKLTSLFKEYCEGLKRKTDHLTFVETTRLFERVRSVHADTIEDPLEQVWKEMVKSDPVTAVGVDDNGSYASYELHTMDDKDDNDLMEESISTVAFLSFLRSQQKEFSKSLEEATELVNYLNRLHTPYGRTTGGRFQSRLPASPSGKRTIAPDDRLTKSRFMDFVRSDFNDLLANEGTTDMERPLSHYFVATSHDTFQNIPTDKPGSSVWGKNGLVSSPEEAFAESFYTTLYRGARCLEVLVWDGPNQGEPFVGSTEDSSKNIRFQECLNAIAYFLKEEPSAFPILLKIENHCSTKVQSVMAQQIRETLGRSKYLYEPRQSLQNEEFVMPSPAEARGKVVLMAKRPRGGSSQSGARVIHDDYDADNEDWEPLSSPSQIRYFDEEEESGAYEGVVVGFSERGPIRSADPQAVALAPSALLEKAEQERSAARVIAEEAKERSAQLEGQARKKEQEALVLAQKVSLSDETKKLKSDRSPVSAGNLSFEEEKCGKDDEGVEIHEVLSDILEANSQEYVKAALEAMDTAKRAASHKKALNRAEEQLNHAKKNLNSSQDNIDHLIIESQKAKQRATANREHADAARARMEHVHNLLRSSEETSTSAETVVVTALTEAKISEKRATDAEARAAKAQANATKDRARSDEETKKEEELEQKVTSLVTKCKEASRQVKEGRQRVEKLAQGLDRAIEQIRLIESSSNYRNEVSSGTIPSGSGSKHGGSFVDKRATKVAEREALAEKLRQASADLKRAEEDKMRYQNSFEELNQVLRLQTELSSKMRKVADRSAHVAEELAEHAEEEREAADLRKTARQRAEANVQNRGTHKESLQTQFQESKRAVSEATALAEKSRKRANELEDELEQAKDFTRLTQIVEEREWGRKEAQSYYDYALAEKKEKDSKMLRQKALVDASDEVRDATSKKSSVDLNRIQRKKIPHQDAIDTYNDAVVESRRADEAKLKAEGAAKVAEEKSNISRRAREYKEKMDRVVEIPPKLAAQTLLHSLRHFHWEKSAKLSNAHYHSIAFHVLHRMIEAQPDFQQRGVRTFTQSRLCRIFPSWNDATKNQISNHDPIFPWSLGCQLVSMNYGSPDEQLLASEGMFRRNASCGYVLKPPQLFGPRRERELQRWSVKILGAYHIPRAGSNGRRQNTLPITPVIRLTLHSGEKGALPFTFETRPSTSKGGDPLLYFEENLCSFDVGNAWVAMATFTVLDKSGEKNDFIAGAAVPVSCFQEGYRSVALFDAHHSRTGLFKFASLLVHVTRMN